MKSLINTIRRTFTKFNEPIISQEDTKQIKQLQTSIQENMQLGDFKAAFFSSNQYQNLVEKYYGNQHPAYFSALNNKAIILKNSGLLDDAVQIQEQVINGYKQLFGLHNKSTLVSMQNLAIMYKLNKKIDEAILVLETVISAREKLIENTKQEGLDTRNLVIELGLAWSQLSSTYRENSNYETAEKMSLKAIEIIQKELGEDNLIMSTLKNNYAFTLKQIKRYKEAENLYIQSLKLRQQFLHETHPDIIALHHNLGELYLSMEDQEKSEFHFREALSLIDKNDAKK